MGTISSGVGLISGLDYTSLVEQLIAAQTGPRDQLLNRISIVDAQRSAYSDISALISNLLSQVESLTTRSFFTAKTVTSSDSDILGVTATDDAVTGSYSFIVKSLATTNQLVSRGYSSLDTQLEPGEISIESVAARVNDATKLDELNGYRGVQRGTFEIYDGDGNVATIDVRDALTLADVMDRINEAEINVTAEIDGDGLLLTEDNGGELRVRELNGGSVAADLGFGQGNTYNAGGRLSGADLVYLSNYTPLDALNDNNGIRRVRAGGDFSINGMTVSLDENIRESTRLGQLNRGQGVDLGRIRITTEDDAEQTHTNEIDLSGLSTVGDIKNAIEGSIEGVTVTLTENKLLISYADNSATKQLKIEDLTGHAARDLGIEGENQFGKIDGEEILHVDTLGSVVAAINHAAANDGGVVASIDGTRLVINGGGSVTFEVLNSSNALADLGFTEGVHAGPVNGQRIIGGIDSALLNSLNGGQGLEPGRINIQVGDSSITLDLSESETMREVIDRINQASEAEGLGIQAGYDHTGTKLIIESLDGTTPITISDVDDGTFAAVSGLAQATPSAYLTGENLQLQYINEGTLLEDLNGGGGVTLGEISITNSLGQTASIDLSTGSIESLQDVIDRINSAAIGTGELLGVVARINDTGDGLVLEDTAGGAMDLEVTDVSGTTASDLNLLGSSSEGVIDGSYEITIALTGYETLEDVAELINEHGPLATASILNDGSGISPYRLQLTSGASGAAGELLVSGLDFTTLSRAQDAKVVLGNTADSGVLLTSSTNTITDIVPGITLDLAGVSDDPITVTVDRDTGAVGTLIQEFVANFNTVFEQIDEAGSYDSETETRGVLLGEHTLQSVERRLQQMVLKRLPGATGEITRLSDLGVSTKEGRLELNEEKLSAAVENNLDQVMELFLDDGVGLATYMKEQLEAITDDGGLIDRRDDTLESQSEHMSDRVEVLNERLSRRAEQLLTEFMALESTLSLLQSQSSALASMATIDS